MHAIKMTNLYQIEAIIINNRGDVVICRSMMNPRQFVCKRIAGLEGDLIRRHDSQRMPWSERQCVRSIIYYLQNLLSYSTYFNSLHEKFTARLL